MKLKIHKDSPIEIEQVEGAGTVAIRILKPGHQSILILFQSVETLEVLRQAIARWQGRQMADEISRSMASTYEVRRDGRIVGD